MFAHAASTPRMMPTTATTPERVPYPVAARELLRNTLLDAACYQLRSRSWVDVTMADIALAAGVSRQTLYNEFGSRSEFAQVLVVREADRVLCAVEEAVNARLDNPTDALASAFDVFVQAVADNPLVHAVVRGQGAEDLLALFRTRGEQLVERAVERLTAIILTGWPLARENAEILSECLLRLAISYTGLPKGPTGISAADVAAVLGPYVEQLVANGA